MNEPEARAAATTIRPAVREDCRAIATLFAMGSEGLAEYLWSAIAEPGENPIALVAVFAPASPFHSRTASSPHRAAASVGDG